MHTPHKHRKCSKCKKLGHNRRTCGVSTPQPFTATNNKPPPALPTKTNTHSVSSASEQFTHLNLSAQMLNLVDDAGIDDEGKVNRTSEYTTEELETLWFLQNDKDGKMGKGKKTFGENAIWTRQDGEKLSTFVQTIEDECPGVSAETWRRFFKNFGAVAKIVQLDKYKPSLQVKWDYDYELNTYTDAFKTGNTKQENPKYPPMPEKFFTTFAKDPSAAVRGAIAMRSGLPEPTMRLLAYDKNIKVACSLMFNAEVPADIIRIVEQRIQTTLETPSTNQPPHGLPPFRRTKSYKAELVELRKGIAANPNCPTEIAIQYNRDENLMSHPGMEVVLYQNPALPQEELLSTFKKTRWEMKKTQRGVGGSQGRSLLRKSTWLRNRLNRIISTGRCPTHITEPYIDHMLKSFSFAGTDQSLGLTISRAKLSEQMVKKLLTKSETPHWRYIVFGLAHNDHSTQETLNWIAQHPPQQHSSWMETRAYEIATQKLHGNNTTS